MFKKCRRFGYWTALISIFIFVQQVNALELPRCFSNQASKLVVPPAGCSIALPEAVARHLENPKHAPDFLIEFDGGARADLFAAMDEVILHRSLGIFEYSVQEASESVDFISGISGANIGYRLLKNGAFVEFDFKRDIQTKELIKLPAGKQAAIDYDLLTGRVSLPFNFSFDKDRTSLVVLPVNAKNSGSARVTMRTEGSDPFVVELSGSGLSFDSPLVAAAASTPTRTASPTVTAPPRPTPTPRDVEQCSFVSSPRKVCHSRRVPGLVVGCCGGSESCCDHSCCQAGAPCLASPDPSFRYTCCGVGQAVCETGEHDPDNRFDRKYAVPACVAGGTVQCSRPAFGAYPEYRYCCPAGTVCNSEYAMTSLQCLTPTPSPTPTASPTNTGTPTQTATQTPSATATRTGTPSATATRTGTPSATATRTGTPSATATRTGTPSATATQTGIPSATATRAGIPSATATQTGIPSATATRAGTPSVIATRTGTPSVTPTYSITVTATATASFAVSSSGYFN